MPAGQDMATKADIDLAAITLSAGIDGFRTRMDGLAKNGYGLRALLLALTPLHLGTLGLYFTGRDRSVRPESSPSVHAAAHRSVSANSRERSNV